jgi:hypothetical protein
VEPKTFRCPIVVAGTQRADQEACSEQRDCAEQRGAFLFGWMGDRVGRKTTFLVTLTGMALGTGAIGLIPTFDTIGLAAAFILFALRMIQGLCLGGQ